MMGISNSLMLAIRRTGSWRRVWWISSMKRIEWMSKLRSTKEECSLYRSLLLSPWCSSQARASTCTQWPPASTISLTKRCSTQMRNQELLQNWSRTLKSQTWRSPSQLHWQSRLFLWEWYHTQLIYWWTKFQQSSSSNTFSRSRS